VLLVDMQCKRFKLTYYMCFFAGLLLDRCHKMATLVLWQLPPGLKAANAAALRSPIAMTLEI